MTSILIVEDDRLTRDLLSRLLQDCGYRAVLASDGVEALSVLDYLRPDLVLLDLMMPRMDGAEFLQRLRESPAGQVPVVVLSALDAGPMIAAARELGVQGQFIKSKTNYDELLSWIESLLKDGQEVAAS